MAATELTLGIDDETDNFHHWNPSVRVTINGDLELGLEVIQYLRKFESSAGKSEVT